MNRLRSLLLLALVATLSSSVSSLAQTVSTSLKNANSLYKDDQFRNALPFYEEVLKAEPDNAEALYKSGICYLNRFSKEKALENILKAYQKDSTVSKHIRYWMGRAYHLNYKFDEALESYTQYKSTLRKRDQRSDDLRIHLEQTKVASEQYKSPKNYLVLDMGNVINSSFSDHSPVISADGKTLYYTSRRSVADGEKEELDGEPFEDILVSRKIDSLNWSKPESIHLNSTGHDASCQLYDNDTKMILYKFHKGGDIYYCEKEGDKWTEPKPFANINTKKFESSAFVTADGNTAYFSTNRYKKNDDLDIYYITKGGDGNWSKIQELKGSINTKFDEDAPFISPDGKTMYFSSRGQKNMGGFDIFKSTIDGNGVWSDPENLGYPINTPDDDVYYYMSSNGLRGYLASYRSKGAGEKDIYEIIPISSIICNGVVTEDVTGTRIDDVTVSFTSQKKEFSSNAASDVSKDGGNYKVAVMSYNTYKIAVIKGGDTLKTELFDIPECDVNRVFTKNIALPYIQKVDTTKKKGPIAHRYVFRSAYFAENKTTLSDETKHELDIAAEILKKNPDAELNLKGYDKSNVKIAKGRAEAVTNYLSEKGIEPSRINTMKAAKATSNNMNNRSVDLDIKLKSPLVMNFDPKIIPIYTVGSSFVLRNVYFVTAKSELKPEGKTELDTLKNILSDFPSMKIELSGHTDDIGDEAYNLTLSEDRAKAAVEYLVSQGIAADRLSYKGYGKSMPYAANDSETNRQLNRRTEVKILSK